MTQIALMQMVIQMNQKVKNRCAVSLLIGNKKKNLNPTLNIHTSRDVTDIDGSCKPMN